MADDRSIDWVTGRMNYVFKDHASEVSETESEDDQSIFKLGMHIFFSKLILCR